MTCRYPSLGAETAWASKTDIGELMLHYGGGGHANAGTGQIANDQAEGVLNTPVQ